ncbi:MAG: riboflavin biosynthesis protein RibF [Bacteroides sp.]|nr:riboflavin biosynthesis protein RibF [Bacteroides sp.]MCM1413786.1 riboflavin biosynthesis protein RibF [Bacteroides sp.]MCM1472195.1 riboflavin biosynthesis protein RibF [Bacteroides sp.]
MGDRLMATIGAFDGVHCGHRDVVRQLCAEASRRGLKPAVVTFSCHPLETIRPEAAPPLLMTPDERLQALQQLDGVRVITIEFTPDLQRLTSRQFMTMLHEDYGVDALLMGFNHRFGSDRLSSPEEYDSAASGSGVAIVHGLELAGDEGSKISSSAIRRRLQTGDVESAAVMLGYPYSLRGEVVAGKQLGRRIGFPTANIRPVDKRQLIPAAGVYACRVVTADGVEHGAMVNIGTRPTVDSDGGQTIEAHLFDFDANVYGQTIVVKFIARLRDEQRFPTIDALQSQLERDAAEARVKAWK